MGLIGLFTNTDEGGLLHDAFGDQIEVDGADANFVLRLSRLTVSCTGYGDGFAKEDGGDNGKKNSAEDRGVLCGMHEKLREWLYSSTILPPTLYGRILAGMSIGNMEEGRAGSPHAGPGVHERPGGHPVVLVDSEGVNTREV